MKVSTTFKMVGVMVAFTIGLFGIIPVIAYIIGIILGLIVEAATRDNV